MPRGSALVYGRYLGGGRNDAARAVAIDSAGYAYVSGGTSSPDFPVINAIQPAVIGLGGPVFKSTSSGSVWSEASAGLGGSVSNLIINPQNHSILYAVSTFDFNQGIYTSTNAGASLVAYGRYQQRIHSGSRFDPINPSNFTPLLIFNFYKSTNAGGSWARMKLRPACRRKWERRLPAILDRD